MGRVDAINGSVLSPHNLPYRMRLLVQSMARKFQNTLEPYRLTPLHWGVLCCLWKEDGLPTTEIAARLEQLPGTVIAGLGAMSRRKLIRRVADRDDRRVTRVWLTQRGRDLEAIVVPDVAALIERMFAGWKEQEVRELSQMVDRLRSDIEQI